MWSNRAMRSFQPSGGLGFMRFHDLPGSGTPLVFLHGLGCASSCDYPRIAADPALSGRRMVLVDLLGAGFSDRPADFGYTVSDHARTVAALVAHMGGPSMDLFGHSMGGTIAIEAAQLLGNRVRRLVLGEPNLDPGGGAFSRRIAAMSETTYVEQGHDGLVRAERATGNDVWAASLALSAPVAVHRGAVSLVVGGRPTWRERLLGLQVPRTVLVGAASLPSASTERLPQQGVDVLVVPAAGHSMAWENPAGVAEALGQATA